jgi:RNA polymerase sigma-70 factor (ECF subfamily)
MTRPTYDTAVRPHLHSLNRWVQKKGLRAEDAEDVVQETLLLGLRHFKQFRFEANIGTWLCRIALNVIRGRMRRPDHTRMVFVDTADLEGLGSPSTRQSPLAELMKNEAGGRVRRAISKLPDDYRVVLELRDMKGYSIRETAEFLALSRPAVKSRHHRARLQLLTCLDA